tara:strand:+ start:13 stop:1059 length:1047 start_codon:yes stop_codon:yes gene_type:complete
MKIKIITKILKLISVNLFVFILFIFVFEIFFGYYFKDNNFGYIMRSERQKDQIYEVKHNNKKYIYNYKRNFYGFRGEEINPSEIKIVFEGGSTGNQKFTPEEITIVGFLNSKLKNLNENLKIINASTDGKTTRGYVNDFLYWFDKLENFKPEYIIFYTGINDSNLSQDQKYDIPWREDALSKAKDYFKNNSKTVELFKKLKFKYFNKEIRKEYGVTKIKENLYDNYKFINYKNALNIHKSYNNFELVDQFSTRLNLLKVQIEKFNIKPIFITQIFYDGLSNSELFLVNETLKNFCKKNKFAIIKLDEMVENLEKYTFYDTMHTTPKGNKIIADKIFPNLFEIINKKGQ